MKAFYKTIFELVTGLTAVRNSTFSIAFLGIPLAGWLIGGATAGAALYSGYKSRKAYEEGGEAARDAAYANAGDLRDLAAFNAGGYREAGAVNANAIRTVGEANALAVERATDRNLFMYGITAMEDRRRHILQERTTAGTIRAMAGSSGVQSNTGSPLHYLNAQVDLGIRERRFGDLKAYWTLRNMREEGEDRAGVIRLTADQQASVTEYNANLQAEMAYAEAMRQAQAMERSGDVQAAVGAAQGAAAFAGGVSSAIGSLGNMYMNFGTPGVTPGLSVNPASGGLTSGAYSYSGSAYNTSSYYGNSGWGSFAPAPATGYLSFGG